MASGSPSSLQPPADEHATDRAPAPAAEGQAPVQLEQLQEAWQRTILPAVGERSTPLAAVLGEARPAALEGETLTLEFPAHASFHRGVAEEPKNATALAEALYEVTGRRLAVAFALGDAPAEKPSGHDEPVSEDELFALMKETFDAREVGGE